MIEPQQLQSFSQQVADFDDRLAWLREAAGADGLEPDRSMVLGELETCHEELRVAEEELRTQHEELVSALEHRHLPGNNDPLIDDLPVATLASDQLGVVSAANRVAAALLGGPANQIIGKPLAAFLAGDRKPFRQLLGRLAGGDHLDRLNVNLRASGGNGPAQRVVLIARRDQDRIRWVMVPEDIDPDARVPEGSQPNDPGAVAREGAHLAIEALTRLPITTASMPDLCAEVERLAAAALPGVHTVTLVLDDAPAGAGADEHSSAAAFPLLAHGNRLGTMYVSGGAAHRLGPTESSSAQLFADAAAAVVSNVRALHESRDLVGHLSVALEHRAIIEQAKGIMMAMRNCDEDTAFDHLRVISQQTNTKLHEVARGLVETMSASPGTTRR